jgi:hypothetical protein
LTPDDWHSCADTPDVVAYCEYSAPDRYRAAADGSALAQLGVRRDPSHGGAGNTTGTTKGTTSETADITLSRMRSLTLGRAYPPAPSAPRPYKYLWRECCPGPGQNRGRPYLIHWILGHLVAAMGGKEGVHGGWVLPYTMLVEVAYHMTRVGKS